MEVLRRAARALVEAHAAGVYADTHGHVFWLGAVLFFALTGRAPLDASPDALRAAVPPKPSSLSPHSVPEAIDTLVLKCLADRRSERFASVVELSAALDVLPTFEDPTEEPADDRAPVSAIVWREDVAPRRNSRGPRGGASRHIGNTSRRISNVSRQVNVASKAKGPSRPAGKPAESTEHQASPTSTRASATLRALRFLVCLVLCLWACSCQGGTRRALEYSSKAEVIIMANQAERYIDPELLNLNGGLFQDLLLKAPFEWGALAVRSVPAPAAEKAVQVTAAEKAVPHEIEEEPVSLEIEDDTVPVEIEEEAVVLDGGEPPPVPLAAQSAPPVIAEPPVSAVIVERASLPPASERPTPVGVFERPTPVVDMNAVSPRSRRRSLAIASAVAAGVTALALFVGLAARPSRPQETPELAAGPPDRPPAAVAAMGLVAVPVLPGAAAPSSADMLSSAAAPSSATPARLKGASAGAQVVQEAARAGTEPVKAGAGTLAASKSVSPNVNNTFATPRPFSRAAAAVAIAAAARGAKGCAARGSAGASAGIRVVFAPSGRVTSASLQGGPLAGTPAGSCVARAIRGARIDPFDGEASAVTTTVRIQ